jgi:hypothetical protein
VQALFGKQLHKKSHALLIDMLVCPLSSCAGIWACQQEAAAVHSAHITIPWPAGGAASENPVCSFGCQQHQVSLLFFPQAGAVCKTWPAQPDHAPFLLHQCCIMHAQ